MNSSRQVNPNAARRSEYGGVAQAKSLEPTIFDNLADLIPFKLDRRDPVLLFEARHQNKPYAEMINENAIHREGSGERALKDIGNGALHIIGGALDYAGAKTNSRPLTKAGSWIGFAAERLDVAHPGLVDQYLRATGGVLAILLVGRGVQSKFMIEGFPLLSQSGSVASSVVAGTVGAAAAADQVYDQLSFDGASKDTALHSADIAFMANLALLSISYRVGLFNHRALPKNRLYNAVGTQAYAGTAQTMIYNMQTNQDIYNGVAESFVIGLAVGGTVGAARAAMRANLLDNMRAKLVDLPPDTTPTAPNRYIDAEVHGQGEPTAAARLFIDEFSKHVKSNPIPRKGALPDELTALGESLDVVDVASIPQRKIAEVVDYFCPRTSEFKKANKGSHPTEPVLQNQLQIAARFESLLGLPDEFVRWQNEKNSQFEKLARDDEVLKAIEAEQNPSTARRIEYADRMTNLMHMVYGSEPPFICHERIPDRIGAAGYVSGNTVTLDTRLQLADLREVVKHENHHVIQKRISGKLDKRADIDTSDLSPDTLAQAAHRFSTSNLIGRLSSRAYPSTKRTSADHVFWENNLNERNANSRRKLPEGNNPLDRLTTAQLRKREELQRHINSFREPYVEDYADWYELEANEPSAYAMNSVAAQVTTTYNARTFYGADKIHSPHWQFSGEISTSRQYAQDNQPSSPSRIGMVQWYDTASKSARQRFDAIYDGKKAQYGSAEAKELWQLLHDDYIQCKQQLQELNNLMKPR